MTTSLYTIADYLFDRIAEAGASEVFGVPGDYNLSFLDNIMSSKKLRWVGNINELNAGYAADGYARERGFAALVTTFGVGELSAVNAIAGSYAEYVPVLQVVGAPSTRSQHKRSLVHHSLADGVFTHFMTMIAPITVASAEITPDNAASEIDRVIETIKKKRRPGYLLLSPDVAKMPIYKATKPLNSRRDEVTSAEALQDFKAALTTFMDNKSTTLLADVLVNRLGLQTPLQTLIAETMVPYATLSWGKSLLNEQSERWAGVYSGAASQARVKDAVESAQCLIKVGVMYTDTITTGFSQDINTAHVIDVGNERTTIGAASFAPLSMRDAISAIHEVMVSGINIVPKPLLDEVDVYYQQGKEDAPLLQNDVWHFIANSLSSKHFVLAEQGTSFFGISALALPEGVTFYGQPLWGSIGYTLPATLGVGVGVAAAHKRGVLLIGDGSALLTIQELSVMLREKINPIIILINNAGYTVERAIHGENQPYNDIPLINWQMMAQAFGGNAANCLALQANTLAELKLGLQTAHANDDKLVFLEVMTNPMDMPPLLKKVAESLQ